MRLDHVERGHSGIGGPGCPGSQRSLNTAGRRPVEEMDLVHDRLDENARTGGDIGTAADGLMGVAGDIIGGLVTDRIKEWRTRNLVNSLAKSSWIL